MSNAGMEVDVKVRDRILKPASEVFAAFIDPKKMSQYFISRASGPMKAGVTVEWEFADVGVKALIDVLEVEEDRKIVYEWDACGLKSRTTIEFTAEDPGTTIVVVSEPNFPLDRDGVKRAMGQTAGWSYTLACLKAFLQFGVNLRMGLNKRITDV